jgi:hypothetical protein
MVMKVATVMSSSSTISLCAVRQSKIKQKLCDDIYRKDSSEEPHVADENVQIRGGDSRIYQYLICKVN